MARRQQNRARKDGATERSRRRQLTTQRTSYILFLFGFGFFLCFLQLCRTFELEKACPFDHCHFAHGNAELRGRPFPPNYKTRPCRRFKNCGGCSFEKRCRYLHDEQRVQLGHLVWLVSPGEKLVRVWRVGTAAPDFQDMLTALCPAVSRGSFQFVTLPQSALPQYVLDALADLIKPTVELSLDVVKPPTTNAISRQSPCKFKTDANARRFVYICFYGSMFKFFLVFVFFLRDQKCGRDRGETVLFVRHPRTELLAVRACAVRLSARRNEQSDDVCMGRASNPRTSAGLDRICEKVHVLTKSKKSAADFLAFASFRFLCAAFCEGLE